MAKSKNQTNHNQNKKAHRNGIKRPQKHKYASRKGVSSSLWAAALLFSCHRLRPSGRLPKRAPDLTPARPHTASSPLETTLDENKQHRWTPSSCATR